MAAKRGPGGRFTSAAPSAPPDVEPLIQLTVEPVDISPADVPPLPEPEPPAFDTADETIADTALGVALARGINELVALLAGAEYRAGAAQVDDVGEAAAPVVRRALSFVHAGDLADSAVPAWVRELATLAARAYVAWGDAFVVIARRQVAELRAQREVSNAAPGSTSRGGGGVRAPSRADGLHDDHPSAFPPISHSDQAGDEEGPDTAAPERVRDLLTVDPRPRGRRPH